MQRPGAQVLMANHALSFGKGPSHHSSHMNQCTTDTLTVSSKPFNVWKIMVRLTLGQASDTQG